MGNFPQNLGSVGVDAQVLQVWEVAQPVRLLETSDIGNDAAGEVEGESLQVCHYLGAVGVFYRFHAFEGFAESGYLCLLVIETMAEGLYLPGGDEGLVALHVDHHVYFAACLLQCLGYAVGSALVVGPGHHGLSAKALHGQGYAIVVRGHVGAAQSFHHPAVNMLYHGLARQCGEGLAGESGGGVAGGDDAHEL